MPQQTLLLVDDEPCFLLGMQRMLRQEPYRLLVAENGPTALAILAEQSVQVVVADYRMPVMDGLVLLTRIRNSHPRIVRILLTAYPDMTIALQAINEVAMFKFLLKPIHQTLFRQTVAAAMKATGPGAITPTPCPLPFRTNRLADLEQAYPGITTLPPRDKDGYFLLDVGAGG